MYNSPKRFSSMFNIRKKIILFISSLMILSLLACSDSSGDTDTEIKKTPIIFSNDQTSSLLLAVNDFPEGWTVKKKGSVISANHQEFLTVKLLEMTLETVLVTTVWTPPTSLAMRDWTSPVRVSVKKPSDRLCRCR